MSRTIIDIYSRVDAINDGVLIEVESEILEEVGVKFPTAVTHALSELLDDMPEHESLRGRVVDMLTMFVYAAKGSIPSEKTAVEAGEGMIYTFILNDSSFKDKAKKVKIKAIVGSGDYSEGYPEDMPPPAVLTFMLPEED